MDITCIPVAKGFVYLTVVLDWHTRRVLSHRVSNTMDVSFCLDTVAKAIRKYGTPDIMNTDQGSQFTGDGFIGLLKDNIKFTLTGCQLLRQPNGCCFANYKQVFIVQTIQATSVIVESVGKNLIKNQLSIAEQCSLKIHSKSVRSVGYHVLVSKNTPNAHRVYRYLKPWVKKA